MTFLSTTVDGVAQTPDEAVPAVGALGGLMNRALPDQGLISNLQVGSCD